MKLTLPLTLLALCSALTAFAGVAVASERAAGTGPNVVVFMTDDQTLRSMRAMPLTRRWLGDSGATFRHAYVNNPRCCPSRATYLTGQYSHNHGVLTNGPPSGGWDRLRTGNWLPSWLHAAGYRTVHIGKFLNRYGVADPLEVPAGWDEWYATVDPTTYRYFGYTVNENGELHRYGADGDPYWYSTDFIARRSEEIVRRLAGTVQPFFLSVAFLAPHTGGPREPGDPPGIATPAVAPRHMGLFSVAPLPITPAFNEADVSDKPPSVRRRPLLRAKQLSEDSSLYRQQLEALAAVDEAVDRVVRALEATGALRRTLIVFTSDNGYMAGQHRIAHGKAQIYDPAVRVPLVVRGPGVPHGVRPRQLVSNADLAPTILDATGALAGRRQDGRSLLPLARNPALGRERAVLIEIARGASVQTAAIRTPRWLYAEHAAGARELYDLRTDPEELNSLHADPALESLRTVLSLRLQALERCRGAGCRSP